MKLNGYMLCSVRKRTLKHIINHGKGVKQYFLDEDTEDIDIADQSKGKQNTISS